MDGGAKIRLAFAALLFWAVLFVLFSGPAFRALATAPAFARAAAAAAWIGCAAFFMGWFFPAGTALFAARENLFPAALAANGFSSVCASQLAAALAMSRGFTETIAWALTAYALCAAATLFGERKKTGRGEAAGAGVRG